MIHVDDVVEEVATKRLGRVNGTRGAVVNGEERTSHWQVYFPDGNGPVTKLFANEEDIRLVKCPHETAEPKFYPLESIMGPQ
ncbi:MAG: hypothetical protein WB729_11220 [Candidatus Sulfotelmatobacter sp.]